MSGKALTAAEILAAQDHRREWVNVPEWGGGVYVQAMPGLALDQYEQRLLARRSVGKDGKTAVSLDNARAELVALTACDEGGAPIFTIEQIADLGKKSGAALNRVVAAAQRLNGLNQKDVEQLAKN